MSEASAPDPSADARLMRLAIALGRRRLGLAWPNPAVGAVVVEPGSNRILGTGATEPGGRPHAEPVALAKAGAAARGATLFVSLEPCSHHGRTPPCAEAVVRAGIARVVTALEDPDPRVAGRGHALLREAGLSVETGVAAREAARAHRGHVTRVRLGRPAVTLKLARTADGIAGRASGPRLLVTGPGVNDRTHGLRAAADAILVGIGTVLADDPRLDVRLPGLEDRRPVRVVLDSRLRLPLGSRLVRTASHQPLWVLCAENADEARAEALAAAGAAILRVPADGAGRVDLPAALAVLGARGLTRVLCEGGPALAEALARADAVDELVLLTGREPFAEAGGIPALGPALAASLGATLVPVDAEAVGPDTVTRFERSAACSPGS